MRRVLLTVAAIAGSVAPVAEASEVRLTTPIAERSHAAGGATYYDYGYVGPPTTDWPARAGGWGTSSDTYICPGGQKSTGLVVVADDLISNDRAFTVMSGKGKGSDFFADVTNWSWYGLHYRVAASCTNNTVAFPLFHMDGCNGSGHCFALGDYLGFWDSILQSAVGRFTADSDYARLIPTAFCWKAGCALAKPGRAKRESNRFPLSNGLNRIAMTFKRPRGSRRPPAIRLAGATGCRSERMHTSVHNGRGRMSLVLACRGLGSGGLARVAIGESIHRSFRLRKGAGTLRIHLDKPLGKVDPYVHVSYGAKGTPCKEVGHSVRRGSTSFDLRIDARCGRVARGSMGHLYVGGLLAPDRTPRPAAGLATARIAHDQLRLIGRSASVPVRCRHSRGAPCVGTLSLVSRLDGRRVVLGSRSYSIKHAFTSRVLVRLSPAARRAVARGRGRLVATAKAVTRQASGERTRHVARVAMTTRTSVTARPSLQWLDFVGTAKVTGDCNPRPEHPVTYDASGTVTGPYPGTFTEQGTYKETDSQDNRGELTTRFTITSGTTTITGTRRIGTGLECPWWADLSFSGGSGTYKAVIKDGGGTTHRDSGLGYLTMENPTHGQMTIRSGFMSDNGEPIDG